MTETGVRRAGEAMQCRALLKVAGWGPAGPANGSTGRGRGTCESTLFFLLKEVKQVGGAGPSRHWTEWSQAGGLSRQSGSKRDYVVEWVQPAELVTGRRPSGSGLTEGMGVCRGEAVLEIHHPWNLSFQDQWKNRTLWFPKLAE